MPNRETDIGRNWEFKRIRNDAYALVAILALGSFLSAALFWQTPAIANWDLMTFYLPWFQLMGESVRGGEIPGWNPHLFSGIPLAGDPQSGWWYVPAMVFFAVFPALLALKLYPTWHVLAMGVFAYVFARLTELSIIGGLAVAVAYTFMQNLGAATCCAVHMQFAPWIPLGLIGIELAMRSSKWPHRLLALSISSVAIAQLAGAWVGQGLLIGSILIGCYLFWRRVCVPGQSATIDPLSIRCARFVLEALWLFGLGLGLAAAGLLIRLDVASRSFVGSESYQAVESASAGWINATLVDAVFDFKSYWFVYYLGGAAIVGMSLGLLLLPKQRSFIFFGLVPLLAFLMPLQPTLIHELFFLIPMFESLYAHDPGRMMTVAPIGVAMLIGLAIEHGRSLMMGWMRWAALTTVGIATVFALRLESLDPEWRPALITFGAGFVFLTGGALFSHFSLESSGGGGSCRPGRGRPVTDCSSHGSGWPRDSFRTADP